MSNKNNEAAQEEVLDSFAAEIIETENMTEESAARLTVKLRRSVIYDGTEIAELHYDFDVLTGKDSREVQREMNAKGKSVWIQSMNEEFMRGMAARACTDLLPDGRKIGADIYDKMAVRDVNRVIARLRQFL